MIIKKCKNQKKYRIKGANIYNWGQSRGKKDWQTFSNERKIKKA
jgi:hypothetical protein